MIKDLFRMMVTAALVATISGCSLFVPHSQSITINGTPGDAVITVNGNTVYAPASIRVPRDKNVGILVSKEGYSPFLMSSGYSLSAWGVLDIIGGVIWLVPFFGLLAPGAYSLDNDTFYYSLAPAR